MLHLPKLFEPPQSQIDGADAAQCKQGGNQQGALGIIGGQPRRHSHARIERVNDVALLQRHHPAVLQGKSTEQAEGGVADNAVRHAQHVAHYLRQVFLAKSLAKRAVDAKLAACKREML